MNKHHLLITKSWLESAIRNRNSEYPIREYIRYMDSLDESVRIQILLNPEITQLIGRINRYNL